MPALVNTFTCIILIANVYTCGLIILTITKLSLVNVYGFTRMQEVIQNEAASYNYNE